MKKVVILGVTGMLGIGVRKAFSDASYQVIGTSRRDFSPGQNEVYFQAESMNENQHDELFQDCDLVINCIGIIKPYINDSLDSERIRAIEINSRFPYQLSKYSDKFDFKVLQIATDCVYSGIKGSYVESDPHDALDVYGKSKSLGEIMHENFMHLRVSIIGPELGRSTSLYEWAAGQLPGAEIGGYTDHIWNGIPTQHYGLIVRGIAELGIFTAGVQHIVPADVVTKEELVRAILDNAGRNDVKVNPTVSNGSVDRTLSTENVSLNEEIWRAAGYNDIPGVEQLVSEITR